MSWIPPRDRPASKGANGAQTRGRTPRSAKHKLRYQAFAKEVNSPTGIRWIRWAAWPMGMFNPFPFPLSQLPLPSSPHASLESFLSHTPCAPTKCVDHFVLDARSEWFKSADPFQPAACWIGFCSNIVVPFPTGMQGYPAGTPGREFGCGNRVNGYRHTLGRLGHMFF